MRENKSDNEKRKREIREKNLPWDDDVVVIVGESDGEGEDIGARGSDRGF